MKKTMIRLAVAVLLCGAFLAVGGSYFTNPTSHYAPTMLTQIIAALDALEDKIDAPLITAVSVTNGQAVAITSGVIELTGIGGAANSTNTITLTTPYAKTDQFVTFRYAGGSNAVKLADSTTVLALGGDISLNATDNLVVYFSSTNTAERVSNADN